MCILSIMDNSHVNYAKKVQQQEARQRARQRALQEARQRARQTEAQKRSLKKRKEMKKPVVSTLKMITEEPRNLNYGEIENEINARRRREEEEAAAYAENWNKRQAIIRHRQERELQAAKEQYEIFMKQYYKINTQSTKNGGKHKTKRRHG